MAPRFVEVSRPVEDGVAWASTLPSTMSTRVKSLVPHNATDMLFERLESMYSGLPEIKFASDFQRVASDAFDLLPEARTETKYLLLAALAAAVLRWFFVLLTSRSILANYGATKVMHKEM
jgi:hypothetical protein